MSKLVTGVDVVLDGETYTLKPSLKAATSICRQFNGYLGAIQQLAGSDLNAFLFIARQAIPTKTIASADLDEAVYAAGVPTLMEPFMKYVRILQNGGREPVEDDGGDGEDDEGNDLHV